MEDSWMVKKVETPSGDVHELGLGYRHAWYSIPNRVLGRAEVEELERQHQVELVATYPSSKRKLGDAQPRRLYLFLRRV